MSVIVYTHLKKRVDHQEMSGFYTEEYDCIVVIKDIYDNIAEYIYKPKKPIWCVLKDKW